MTTIFPPEYESLAKSAECWETDEWAVRAILKCEILTPVVVDPCCGPGIMSAIAADHGYNVIARDLHNWHFGDTGLNFLTEECTEMEDSTAFMNPPFSLACAFVDRAMELGARKIVCFQRWAWWESNKRQDWWRAHPPGRIYACADRANCNLVTFPQDKRDAGGGTKQAHGWFVWERNQPNGTIIGHISKDMAK